MAEEKTTWKPRTEHGKLSTEEQNDLPESAFAFPRQRKEPLTDAAHVRNALARFDQVTDVSDADRDLAWRNILAAARHYGVEVRERSWRDLGRQPHTTNPAH
jgi:hypothetical protein